MVAISSQTLCNSAGEVMNGIASHDRLVAAAKAVASSTAQLLIACQVKADPDSRNFRRLQVNPSCYLSQRFMYFADTYVEIFCSC